MPSINSNNELLNVINDDVKSIKEWSNMPAISEEDFQEFITTIKED